MTRKKLRRFRIALLLLNYEINKLEILEHSTKRAQRMYKAKNKIWEKIEQSIDSKETK